MTFSGDTTQEEGLPGLGLERSWQEALREKEGDREAEPAEVALSSSCTVERLGTVIRVSEPFTRSIYPLHYGSIPLATCVVLT